MIPYLIAFRRLARLAWAILYGLTVDRPSSSPTGKAEWQQRQACRMLRALETNVSGSGTLPAEGLMVCNHLSYLDTIVIGAQAPLVFVAKSDVRKWPVIGLLLKSAGTILADRSRRSSAAETSSEILRAMESGLPVVFFPEGTSSDGSSVLPFKPALLQIALDTHKPITPAAISYEAPTGDLKNDVCYWGDHTFATHIIRLAKIRNLTARLTIGNTPPLPAERKAAARTLHAEVTSLLTSTEQTPILSFLSFDLIWTKQMKTFTANETKQNFGQVLDSARTAPVSITKHGRPEFIITSREDYEDLARAKFELLRSEVRKGFDAFDRGDVSTLSVAEIAAEAIRKHSENAEA